MENVAKLKHYCSHNLSNNFFVLINLFLYGVPTNITSTGVTGYVEKKMKANIIAILILLEKDMFTSKPFSLLFILLGGRRARVPQKNPSNIVL